MKSFRAARRLAHLAGGPAGRMAESRAPEKWLRTEADFAHLDGLGFGKEFCQPLLLRCHNEGTNKRCLMLDVGRHPMHLQANCPLTPNGQLLMTQHLLHDRLASSDSVLRVRAGE